MIGGCSVPQRVVDDIQALKIETQALYSFNQEFLKRANSNSAAELEKKTKMIMISKIAYQRAMEGLDLLSEYMGSSEVISKAQLAATEETINKIADRVKERLSND